LIFIEVKSFNYLCTIISNHKAMETTATQFETGASTHTVNDLILFIENDREAWDMIENLYKGLRSGYIREVNSGMPFAVGFGIGRYIQTFPTSSDHVRSMTTEERAELIAYFVGYYKQWKEEN
jgi:hypothetical protein